MHGKQYGIPLAVCLAGLILAGCGTVAPTRGGRVLVLSNRDAASSEALRKELQEALFEVELVSNPAVLETGVVNRYDGLILDYRGTEPWPPERQHALTEYVAQGRGLILPVVSGGEFPDWDEYRRLVALTIGPESEPFAPGPFRIVIKDSHHPITRGIEDFRTWNAPLSNLRRNAGFRLLAFAAISDSEVIVPAVIAKTYGEGRVFHITLAHSPFEAGTAPDGVLELFRGGVLWAVRNGGGE